MVSTQCALVFGQANYIYCFILLFHIRHLLDLHAGRQSLIYYLLANAILAPQSYSPTTIKMTAEVAGLKGSGY